MRAALPKVLSCSNQGTTILLSLCTQLHVLVLLKAEEHQGWPKTAHPRDPGLHGDLLSLPRQPPRAVRWMAGSGLMPCEEREGGQPDRYGRRPGRQRPCPGWPLESHIPPPKHPGEEAPCWSPRGHLSNAPQCCSRCFLEEEG